MEFPYKAFKLTPSFQVKEVTVIGNMGTSYVDWLKLETGAQIHLADLHETLAEAVKAGMAQLDKQSAHAQKLIDSIEKRRTNLRKAKA